jgi:hypothetical protein
MPPEFGEIVVRIEVRRATQPRSRLEPYGELIDELRSNGAAGAQPVNTAISVFLRFCVIGKQYSAIGQRLH